MYEPAEVFFFSDNHTPFADSQVKDYVVNGARPYLVTAVTSTRLLEGRARPQSRNFHPQGTFPNDAVIVFQQLRWQSLFFGYHFCGIGSRRSDVLACQTRIRVQKAPLHY
jgi:hypothetical protein